MTYYLFPMSLICPYYDSFSSMTQYCIFEGASILYEMQYALVVQIYWVCRGGWALIRTRLDKLGLNHDLILGKSDLVDPKVIKPDAATNVMGTGDKSVELAAPKVGQRANFTHSDSVQVKESAGFYKATRDQVQKPKDLSSHSKDRFSTLTKSRRSEVLTTLPSTLPKTELLKVGNSTEFRTKDQASLSLGASELASLISLKSPSYVLRYDQLVTKLNIAKDLRWIARDSLLDRSANLSLTHQDAARLGVGRASAWFKPKSFNPQLSNSHWLTTYSPLYTSYKFNSVLTSGPSQRALAGRLASQIHLIDLVTWGCLLENSNYNNYTVQVSTFPTKDNDLTKLNALDLGILPQLRNQLSGTVNLQSSISSRCIVDDGSAWVYIPDSVVTPRTHRLVLVTHYPIKVKLK